jgi:predicted transcriptional regulator
MSYMRTVRKHVGLTQKALGFVLGIGQSNIARLEKLEDLPIRDRLALEALKARFDAGEDVTCLS